MCLIDVMMKITNTNVRMDDNGDAHVHVIYADCADSGLAILYSCILSFGYMWANYKVHLTSRFHLKSLAMTWWLGQTLASVNSHEFGNDFDTLFKVVRNGPNCNLLFCGFWSNFPSNTVETLMVMFNISFGFCRIRIKVPLYWNNPYHYIETILYLYIQTLG